MMDTLDFIMRYEGGECTEDEIVKGFQALVDSGLAWQLQGSYGRMAAHLINVGLVTVPGSREPKQGGGSGR